MKKKLLAILMTLSMVVCMMPAMAFAEGEVTEEQTATNVEQSEAELAEEKGTEENQVAELNPASSYVYIANGSNDSINVISNPSGSIGGGTYSYDANKRILTLTNTTIDVDTDRFGSLGGITVENLDLTVRIEGTCTIRGTGNSDEYHARAIHSDGNTNITLTGSGSLNITGNADYVIYAPYDDNIIVDGVTINATNVKESGIFANNITFNNMCNVNLTSENKTIYATDEITFNLTEGGKVDATSTLGYAAIYASAPNTIIIAGNNRITTPENGINYNIHQRWYIANAEDNTPATHAVIEGPEPTTTTPAKTKFLAQGKAYKTSIKYSWNKVSGATKYKVYQAKCGKKKYKCVKTTTGTSYTKKSLRRKATYKAYVVAYNKSGKKLATTPLIHNMTTKGGRSNATAVSAKKTASVKAGSKINVKAKISKKDSKKTLLWKNHASAAIRYFSANKSVATVDAKGNVKGVKAGTANIYAVAPSGVYAVTKVTVKAK